MRKREKEVKVYIKPPSIARRKRKSEEMGKDKERSEREGEEMEKREEEERGEENRREEKISLSFPLIFPTHIIYCEDDSLHSVCCLFTSVCQVKKDARNQIHANILQIC